MSIYIFYINKNNNYNNYFISVYLSFKSMGRSSYDGVIKLEGGMEGGSYGGTELGLETGMGAFVRSNALIGSRLPSGMGRQGSLVVRVLV